MADLPILTIMTFVPALAALLIALIPAQFENVIKQVALSAAVLIAIPAVWLFFAFEDPAAGELAFHESIPWVQQFRIRYEMGIDGIALVMVVLTALLTPLAMLCSWHAIKEQVKGFFAAMLLLECGMIGVFCAADLFLFYVFWELMLMPMALMIGIWGGPNRVYAAVKFVIYTLAGSLLMFVAILYSYGVAAEAIGVPTFNIIQLQNTLPGAIEADVQWWLFAAFALSFAIKVPMFPFHTWLPDAHVQAPTAGSVILAGVLLKMGAYGFLRFGIPFFPMAAAWFAPLFIALSVIGILYGSLMALAQDDIKKLIAYSSVAHLGFVTLGIFSGSVMAAQGGVMQMVNHGISTGALFLLVGVIYERTHTRGVNDFGGLAKTMPIYATIFLIITLASIGLPGTNGFVGEFLVLNGTYQNHPFAAALAGLGVILAAGYMLTMYRNVFFGKVPDKWADLKDMSFLEGVTLVPLVIACIWLGVLPNHVLHKTEASVTQVVQVLTVATAKLEADRKAEEVADAR